jgi:hypothetical protein
MWKGLIERRKVRFLQKLDSLGKKNEDNVLSVGEKELQVVLIGR